MLPLTGQRITLALPAPGDEEPLRAFHAHNAAHFKPWFPRPGGDLQDLAFWNNWITLSHNLFQREAACHLVMRLAGAQTILGQIDYSLIIRGPLNSTMVGFQIDHAHQGQGLMREGLALSLPFIFDTLKVRRVVAAYVPSNVRSERLLASLRFTQEGVAREFLEIDGELRDHIVTARLASDARS